MLWEHKGRAIAIVIKFYVTWNRESTIAASWIATDVE